MKFHIVWEDYIREEARVANKEALLRQDDHDLAIRTKGRKKSKFKKSNKKPSKNKFQKKKKHYSKYQCYNCHKIGHLARECPSPKNNNNNNKRHHAHVTSPYPIIWIIKKNLKEPLCSSDKHQVWMLTYSPTFISGLEPLYQSFRHSIFHSASKMAISKQTLPLPHFRFLTSASTFSPWKSEVRSRNPETCTFDLISLSLSF